MNSERHNARIMIMKDRNENTGTDTEQWTERLKGQETRIDRNRQRNGQRLEDG